MKKILPFNNPDIIHSPQDTYVFAILDNYSESKEWIMMNFMNIQMDNDDGTDNFFPKWIWNFCPGIEASEIAYSECMKNWISFIEFCKYCIDRGRYVCPMLNVRYISLYKREHDYEHNPIVYGYDDEKEEVYIADFFQNGMFSLETCSYSEINTAFEKLVDVDGFESEIYLGYSAKFTILEYKNFNYVSNSKSSDKSYYKNQIMNFIESKPYIPEEMAIQLEDNFCYGIGCIDLAITKGLWSRRFLVLLNNWSRLWIKRIEFFISEDIIADDKEIIELAKTIYSLSKINLYKYLKYEARLNICEDNTTELAMEEDINSSLLNYKEQVHHFMFKLMEIL